MSISCVTEKRQEEILDAINKGIFKIYKNGKVYKIKKKKNQYTKYESCKPFLLNTNSIGKRYLTFGIRKETYLIHNLVWLYFNDKILEDLQINHKNGIKHDNRLSNLELITQSENMKHRTYVLGIRKLGEESNYHKLKNKDVLKVKKLLKNGFSRTEIAKLFNVTSQNISSIALRRTWAWL